MIYTFLQGESKGKIMNIGKAAKLSNLTIKAVRYYANIGLVKPQQNLPKTSPL